MKISSWGFLAPKIKKIPDELKSIRQWVCFDSNKHPINPRTGAKAKVDTSTTWATYEDAASEAVHLRNCSDIKGIGFVFTTGDP